MYSLKIPQKLLVFKSEKIFQPDDDDFIKPSYVSWTLSNEVGEWLYKNIKDGSYGFHNTIRTIDFERKEDAILFSLRWL